MTLAPEEMFVVHVSPRVQARGGIETLHRYHRELPGRQVFIALFDRQPEPRADYVNLGFTWRTPLREMRRRFARVMAGLPDAVVAYHNGWGLPLFHDLDRAARRVVFLHADPVYHAPDLPGFAGLIDAAQAISPGQRTGWAEHFPAHEPERLAIYPAPIRPMEFRDRAARPPGAPRVLGYAGRVERGDKRLDLLPGFLDRLEAEGVAYRFEVVGTGSLLPWLRRQLAGRPVIFREWVDDDAYRRIPAEWDGAVYFSEHEGGPIALLEAMSAGAIPFYPAHGGSWADHYVPQVDPLCHYPPGDLAAAASAVRRVFSRPESELAGLRARARQLVCTHTPERYRAVCADLLTRIGAMPRISASRTRSPRIGDWLPLGVATRFFPSALRAN